LSDLHFEVNSVSMKDFPEFMKRAANRIAGSSQATPGAEGYLFDGTDGSQMAFWTCAETATSAPHVHDFDEYMVVVEGCYTLILYPEAEKFDAASVAQRIPVKAGEEYFIPQGVWHGGEVVAGTRTIHAFGGRRAERSSEK
jgi:mannose-6-phosphate isomerase-like protein (cupin superfamily)